MKTEQRRDQDRVGLERSLLRFVEAAWPSIDPSNYESCWAIDALCEHLQAVTDGQCKRLLINFPPRCGKTSVASVAYIAWTWARRQISYLSGPQVRFLCGSYNHDLSLTNSNLTRRLILSPWYQSLWGDRYEFRIDQNTKAKFDNSSGGSRIATSVGGSLLGLGGDIVVIDDPHNTESVESEPERQQALRWWKEISTTRLNEPKQSAIVVIMQRLHEEDVSGVVLSSEWGAEWQHLCIPMRYEWNRHCVTSLPWQDPRGLDDEDKPLVLIDPQNGDRYPRDDAAGAILDNEREGELMWPQRFGPTELARIESELGPYMASGRLQQKPVPDRGGIFQRAWWQLWAPANGKFPVFDYIIASLDSAFTENEQNDPSALTIWGVFTHPETKERGIMLVDAWRKWLQMHGAPTPRNENETPRIGDDQEMKHRRLLMWHRRVSSEWGLVEWVAYTCQLRHVDKLLIEAKATGITAAQELQRLHGREGWAVQLCPVKGDKVARALAVQPTFSQQMVWAPARDWSEMTIDELAVFPKGKYDDLTDSSTQALKYLRDSGLAETKAEVAAEAAERVRHKPKLVPLYQV